MKQVPKHREMTTPPDLSRTHRTGPHRTFIPRYVDRLPPCNEACPAGENVQAWLAEAQAGRARQAWEIIVRDNPFPAIHGRVCYHNCETACNRKLIDDAVSIHSIERYLGDKAIEEGWELPVEAPDSGKKVLVVGAGPSGLSAAYHIRRAGHSVEIREAGPMPGGMLHFGIPKYRLPRNILDAEISRIAAMGVKIILNHRVSDLVKEQEEGGFDAAFIAVGAHLGKSVQIPSHNALAMMDAVEMLRKIELGKKPALGRKVAVYGGGNTAMDAARTVKRLGIEDVVVIYRRDRASAPAHDEEIQDALDEGIKINWLRSISSIESRTIHIEQMLLNETGLPTGTGVLETLDADALILALGQDTDTHFLREVPGIAFNGDGTIIVDHQMMTGAPGIFAGGDMVPYERSVTVAVGHGKKAARNINAWLKNKELPSKNKRQLASFDLLNTWYYTEAPASSQPRIEIERRKKTFDEVVEGLTEKQMLAEAQRCLSCGNCYECDGCLGSCPEDAVIKLGAGNRYRFDYDKCIGCGVCHDQCPCGAIELVSDREAPSDQTVRSLR